MALSGSQLKQIQHALLSGFDDENLEMMVRLELDEELSVIAGGKTRISKIHNLILWADRTGRVKELVLKAHEYNPGNELLKELADVIDSWLEPPIPKSTQHAISTPPEKPRQPFEPEMVLIPAGNFLMGSDPINDKGAQDDEFWHHSLFLSDYYIGKTPITNFQYLAFVQMANHQPPKYWKRGQPSKDKFSHPVVHISWHDAVFYGEWLSKVTRREYRLPTEAEWEKAARGADGRIYPWGDESPTDRLCNFDSNVGGTTPVGKYPSGTNGLVDMAGNVWEWTSTIWGNSLLEPDFCYPYEPDDGREDLSLITYRIMRGGSFNDYFHGVRCAGRKKLKSVTGGFDVGFRVCLQIN